MSEWRTTLRSRRGWPWPGALHTRPTATAKPQSPPSHARLWKLWHGGTTAPEGIGARILLLFVFWIGRRVLHALRPKAEMPAQVVKHHHHYFRDSA